MSLSNKIQEQVAAQIDSEVYLASLGALRITLERWCFYERLNFLYEHMSW